eukprot:523126_1
MRTSQSLRRLEATCRSPIYSYFTICFAGVSTIRSSNKQRMVLQQAFNRIENHAAVSLIYIACQRWIAFVLDASASVCLIITVFACLWISNTVSNAAVGISLTYLMTVIGSMSYGVRQFADTEDCMTSTERIIEYGNLNSEQDELEIDKNKMVKPPNNWPHNGEIEIKNLSVSYRSYLKPALNNGQKLGLWVVRVVVKQLYSNPYLNYYNIIKTVDILKSMELILITFH